MSKIKQLTIRVKLKGLKEGEEEADAKDILESFKEDIIFRLERLEEVPFKMGITPDSERAYDLEAEVE